MNQRRHDLKRRGIRSSIFATAVLLAAGGPWQGLYSTFGPRRSFFGGQGLRTNLSTRRVAHVSSPKLLMAVGFLIALTVPSYAGVAIYGGPTDSTSPPYRFVVGNGQEMMQVAAGSVGVAAVTKYQGNRPFGGRIFRWSGSVVEELGGLGTDPNGFTSVNQELVSGINLAGDAVGMLTKYVGGMNKGNRPVRWNAGGTAVTELNGLGTSAGGLTSNDGSDAAHAVNDSGMIVGSATKYVSGNYKGSRAVRWDPGSTTAIELETLGTNVNGLGRAVAKALSNSGIAVGNADKYENGNSVGARAVRWDAGQTTATELGHLGTSTTGSTFARATAVNETGTAVGYAAKWQGSTNLGSRPVRWEAGQVLATELGHLGIEPGATVEAFVNAINEAGSAVGTLLKRGAPLSPTAQAVRWDAASTTAIPLDTLDALPGEIANASAFSINDFGAAVGQCAVVNTSGSSAVVSAVLWIGNDPVVDLGTFLSPNSGWAGLWSANQIDNTGWIAGNGHFDPDGPGGASVHSRPYTLLVPQAGTYGRGDANFDTLVNFDDLLILAQHYGQANPTQDVHVADLNLDGVTDFDDLLALAQHYDGVGALDVSGLGEVFAGDWALAQSLVPEPFLSAVAIGTGVVTRRRRM